MKALRRAPSRHPSSPASPTRRDLAGAILFAPAAALSPASAAAAQPPAPDLDQARQAVRRNSQLLSSFQIAMAVEPSFQFKA